LKFLLLLLDFLPALFLKALLPSSFWFFFRACRPQAPSGNLMGLAWKTRTNAGPAAGRSGRTPAIENGSPTVSGGAVSASGERTASGSGGRRGSPNQDQLAPPPR